MAQRKTLVRWSAEEVEFLVANYGEMTAEAIANALDRTPDSILEKANREGLRKKRRSQARDADGPWYCPECTRTLPKEDFSVSKAGKGSAYCRSCVAQKAKERRAGQKRKQERAKP